MGGVEEETLCYTKALSRDTPLALHETAHSTLVVYRRSTVTATRISTMTLPAKTRVCEMPTAAQMEDKWWEMSSLVSTERIVSPTTISENTNHNVVASSTTITDTVTETMGVVKTVGITEPTTSAHQSPSMNDYQSIPPSAEGVSRLLREYTGLLIDMVSKAFIRSAGNNVSAGEKYDVTCYHHVVHEETSTIWTVSPTTLARPLTTSYRARTLGHGTDPQAVEALTKITALVDTTPIPHSPIVSTITHHSTTTVLVPSATITVYDACDADVVDMITAKDDAGDSLISTADQAGAVRVMTWDRPDSWVVMAETVYDCCVAAWRHPQSRRNRAGGRIWAFYPELTNATVDRESDVVPAESGNVGSRIRPGLCRIAFGSG